MTEKVSIIIPVYNCAKYIEKTINSIKKQTYSNIEVILIDDGSTDDSLEKCKEMAKNQDIKVIHQENFGAPSARNKGIDVCSGQYILLFDSDDILLPTAIEKMVERYQKDNLDLVIGKTIKIDAYGRKIGDKISKPAIETHENELFLYDPFPGNKLYKAEIIKTNNIRFGNVRIGQDLNFYLKYCAYVKKYKCINDTVSKYRVLENSISRTYSFKIFDIVESYNDIEKFYKKNNLLTDDITKVLNSSKCFHYYSQIKKITNFKKFKEKIIIIKYFNYFLNKSLKNNNICKRELIKLRLKLLYLEIIRIFR